MEQARARPFLALIGRDRAAAGMPIPAFRIFEVRPFAACVMVARAALPGTGNVYILERSDAVARRLLCTVPSVGTITAIGGCE